MFAIGNDELENSDPIREDGKATCPKCGKLHPIEYGERVMEDGTKIPSRLLGLVECGESSYLVSINEKIVNPKH